MMKLVHRTAGSQAQRVQVAPAQKTDPPGAASGAAQAPPNWRPTAEWAGRLILPKENQRNQGGVYFEVRQAPDKHKNLKGQKIWLNLEPAPWVDRVTRDIDFSKRTEKGKKLGYQHPQRLDGWDQVSPLETLAGTRHLDDMLVELKDVKVSGFPPTLTVESEPVQLSGTQKALVTFEKKIDPHTWEVRHWNPETRDFTGPTEVVKTIGREDLAPMKDRRLNAKGWYLYGDPGRGGKMEVAALEPRQLLQVSEDQVINGRKAALHYLSKENWNQPRKGDLTKTVLQPAEDKPFSGKVGTTAQKLFKLGEKAILFHLFGGALGNPTVLGVFMGHFSFGIAEVVEDEFTGEHRFDVEYKQVYAHNEPGVVSGSQKWHTYMGDTQRGKVYHLPVVDTLVKVPELFDDSLGTDPSKILDTRLSEMMARYRSGEGDGSSQVTTAQNCSQDSSQALYATISDWKKAIKDGTAQPALLEFCEQLSGHITPIFGWAPQSWSDMANDKKAEQCFLRWLPGLKAYNTMFPRANSEGLTKMALKADMPVVLIKTDTLGADNPEAIPEAPFKGLNPFA